MELPGIIHPKRFVIGGITFEIAAYHQLTDQQAHGAAMLYYRSRKWRKKDRRAVVQVQHLLDEDFAGFLGE